MANKLGQLSCLENTKNVGFGGCFLDWKQIRGALLYDKPRTFSASEIAALETTLLSDAAADAKSARMFPIHKFVAPTDNSEDVILETFDYGSKAIVRDGDIDWTFQYVDGGGCLSKALRTHNGKRWVLFYDSEFKIMGYDLRGQLSAIPLQFFYASPFKLATGSTTAKYMVRFVFESKYANEESQFIKSSFDPSEIAGLQDIDIILNTWDQDTGVANVTLQIACGAENIYDLFNGQIVAATFTAYDADGNVVDVESVAAVPGSETFDITLDVADLPDDGIVTIEGVAVSVLVGQEIEGYEIGEVEVTVVGS